MEEFKPNSFKYRKELEAKTKAEEEKKEKVTTGKVITKKPSVGKKVAGDFIKGDLSRVKDTLIYEYALPALKKTVSEGFSAFVDMMLYGETRRHDRGESRNGGSRVSYSSYYDDRNRDRGSRIATSGGGYTYEEVLFDSRKDAENVLDEMWNDIKRFGSVSVADMYDHAGVQSNKYTDNNYGWTEENFTTADVGTYSDGMKFLKLARPVALRR